MSPIELRRAMKRRGWSYSRRAKGEALFAVRFPNGFGVTQVVSMVAIGMLAMSPSQLANYLTLDAAHSARFDLQRVRDAGVLER